MAFIETPRFPDCYSYQAAIGPAFSTSVAGLKGGHESRNENWDQERLIADLSYINRTQAERDEISAFYRLAKGRLRGFRVKDHSDYAVGAGEGVILQNAVSAELELFKKYVVLGETYYRRIHKPIDPIVLSGAGTVDYTDGTVPGATDLDTWTGEFDVPMRFDIDQLQWTVVERTASDGYIYSVQSLVLVQIRAGLT